MVASLRLATEGGSKGKRGRQRMEKK